MLEVPLGSSLQSVPPLDLGFDPILARSHDSPPLLHNQADPFPGAVVVLVVERYVNSEYVEYSVREERLLKSRP